MAPIVGGVVDQNPAGTMAICQFPKSVAIVVGIGDITGLERNLVTGIGKSPGKCNSGFSQAVDKANPGPLKRKGLNEDPPDTGGTTGDDDRGILQALITNGSGQHGAGMDAETMAGSYARSRAPLAASKIRAASSSNRSVTVSLAGDGAVPRDSTTMRSPVGVVR